MRPANVALEFHGAIDTVTGSRYLLATERARVLVDCGLFQGPKKLRERNWQAPAFDVTALDAVVLTHAHIDHTGYLPRLCKLGFTGPIYCTPGTRDLLALLLPDAGYLQEEAAAHANRHGYSRHQPALPLYTRADAERTLAQLVPHAFGASFEPARDISTTFHRAGHIIGSACVTFAAGHGTRITFSGDVGRPVDPIMRPPALLGPTDYLVIESTYGDRRHANLDLERALERIVIETLEKRGTLIVPAFAVGRAQHLMHLLARLRTAGRIPPCPIYLDSPMAIDASGIFGHHPAEHRLSPADWVSTCSEVRYAHTADDSRAIDRASGPMIVIAASGMCTGGRVLHHLARFLPDERSTVLFVGYQASGTRGRSLVDGASELKLLGQYVPVRARIAQLDGLSAHADFAELIEWLRESRIAPRQVFVTHGEPAAADAFRRRLHEAFGWNARVPEVGERVVLEPA